MEDIFKGVGVEVLLSQADDFLKVKETLTRIGIASRKEKRLFQSCHILHKQGRYAIVHFKELFYLDGKDVDFSEDDLARRNTIVNLLSEWKLVKILNSQDSISPTVLLNQVKIISFREKNEWDLCSKYAIGKKH